MKNNLLLRYPTLLWAFLLFPFTLTAQTFIDLPGPMGTTSSLLRGPNGDLFLGSNSKGVFRSVNQGQNWSGLGGNTIMTGRINAMIFDTSGQLWAATEQGGIKSWNGTAWISFNTGLLTGCGIPIPIRTLALDAQGTLYAGAHTYSACFPNGDLYRFDGNAWNSISAGLGNTNINSLAIHPLTGHLYAGTDGGIFRSDGNSWSTLNSGLGDSVVHKLIFAPNGDLYAGTQGGLAFLPFNSLLWTQLNSGLNGDPVHAIALDTDPSHILIGTGYSVEQTGSLYGQLFESQDAGQHWTQVSPGIQSTVIKDLIFAENQIWLAAGWGVFKSLDNGLNWSPANAGFTAKSFNTQGRIAVTPAPNQAIFYGSDEGVFRSSDEGQSWTLANQGLSRHIVTLLKADHFGNLFCGVMRYLGENSVGFGDGVLYKSTDQGNHWAPVSISKDWRYMEMSELADGTLICAHGFGAQPPSATIIGSSLARSTDHGDTWQDLDVQSGMAFCCAANAAGDLFVAGESQSVYRSTDGGNSFELIVAPGQEGNVGTLEVSPSGDILMSSGGQRTFYFSTDNGTNYSTFSSPVLPDYRGVSDVIFDDQGKAFCTTTGQNGMPSLFTVSPPFSSGSSFVPVSGLAGSFFKMCWDECGYLYLYRAGGVLKSSVALRLPEDGCVSGLKTPLGGAPDLAVFPNPVGDILHIHPETPDLVSVELWNLCGQKLEEINFSGKTDLSLSARPVGLYLLKIKRTNGSDSWIKIVKD